MACFRIRGMPTVVVSTPAMNDARRSVDAKTSGIMTMTSRGKVVAPKATQNVTRGVTFQWTEFRPRDLEAKSGMKSLRRVLEIDDLKKFSNKIDSKV